MAQDAEAAADAGFLEYHEPTVLDLLTIISFFFFLALAEWVSDKVFKAGLIGQMCVGLLYGIPIGNIMPVEWQETFVSLGYIGLILIIFEGGLTVNLTLLKANFFLSFCAAAIGILFPIALCYIFLYVGFGYGPVEVFIIGAALSVTSLGTTFVVIGSAAKGIDFAKTKVGTVLISAAVVSDVCGLIMASVIHNLGDVAEDPSVNIGWLIGRPVLASALLGILAPLTAKYVASPLFRFYLEDHFARFKHISNVVLMVTVLSGFIAIAGFAGASALYGAFLAGTFVSSLPCIHPDGPFMVFSREHGETDPDKTPTFIHTFEKYFLGAQTYILQPMFFASIGFAIPFKKLWTGRAIWMGVVFFLIMLAGKLIVGLIVPIRDVLTSRPVPRPKSLVQSTWKPAALLGVAMVARGEIGLLIIQIGLNETPYVSEDVFIIATWAVVLSTIVGPVTVGLLLRRYGRAISDDKRWGMQNIDEISMYDSDDLEEGRGSRWASRRHSRAVNTIASSRSRSRAHSRAHSVDVRAFGPDGSGPLTSPPAHDRSGEPDADEIRRVLRRATESNTNLAADRDAGNSDPALGGAGDDQPDDDRLGVPGTEERRRRSISRGREGRERRRVITYNDTPVTDAMRAENDRSGAESEQEKDDSYREDRSKSAPQILSEKSDDDGKA